jgi:thioredoxin-dependent peroxiredoxin
MKKQLAACALLFLSFSTFANQWEGVPLVEFKLKDQLGIERTNKDFKGQWLVLYFYPKDKTPGCTVEAQNFTNDYSQYQLLNTQVVGVSYDDVASHKDFSDTYEMPFVLLADVDKKLSKAMDVDNLFPWPHASRQTFVVDPEGNIVKHYPKVSPKNHSKQLLKFLTLIQSTKK